jgi:hypothetical protein
MEEHRVEKLARYLAARTSRRGVLYRLGGAAALAALSGFDWAQGRRGTSILALAGPTEKRVKAFRKTVSCPDPCRGSPCVFQILFLYEFHRLRGGSIQITKFEVRFSESEGARCKAEFLGAEQGAVFQFKCAGAAECAVTPQNVWTCPCGTTIQFEDMDPSDAQNCVCPPAETFTQGKCGEPQSITRACTFETIDLDVTHGVLCICRGRDGRGDQINQDTLRAVVHYKAGEITFGGDAAPGGEP